MLNILTLDTFFVLWWVLVNGFLYYAEIDFLIHFAKSDKRQHLILYIIIQCLGTIIAIWTQMFSVLTLFQIIFIFVYMAVFYGVSPKRTFTPVIIIFTLSSFMEGFVAIIMRFLSNTLENQILGLALQFILPAGFTGLVFLSLRLIAKRYPLINKDGIFSYLYVLLLPCALIIWGIRTSLGLDRNHGQFSPGVLLINNTFISVLYVSLWMVGALIIFFIIIEVFHKITVLSQQDMEKALLANQIKEQHSYIAEASQRNERYSSYLHDINNHLLVLSGLLNKKEYKQVGNYLEKLNLAASGISENVSTGNAVVDVLLDEKIRYAEQYNISVTYDVQIPLNCTIDNIDLCIIFSNALDNAIHACKIAASQHKTIALVTKQKNSFLLIEIVNDMACPDKPISYGTGLKNIKFTVEKYNGIMYTYVKGIEFCLSVLLCL